MNNQQEETMFQNLFYDLKVQEYAKLLRQEMKQTTPNDKAVQFYQQKVEKYQTKLNMVKQ